MFSNCTPSTNLCFCRWFNRVVNGSSKWFQRTCMNICVSIVTDSKECSPGVIQERWQRRSSLGWWICLCAYNNGIRLEVLSLTSVDLEELNAEHGNYIYTSIPCRWYIYMYSARGSVVEDVSVIKYQQCYTLIEQHSLYLLFITYNCCTRYFCN